MLEVTVINQQDAVEFVEPGLIDKVLQEVWKMEGGEGEAEVNVILVDDAQMRQFNREYRGKDDTTDVLSFAMEEIDPLEPASVYELEDGPRFLGDIVISLQRAVDQAEEYGHSLQREVGYLTVHGMLHLLGYDHQEEADRLVMRNKEETVMTKVALQR